MSTPTELIVDPVFQLNALLWLSTPLPSGFGLRPLLREAGFEVHSIAPGLSPAPADLLAMKKTGLRHQETFRPDVVLQRKVPSRTIILFECKANSFSPASSAAEQARTMLVASGPSLPVLLNLPLDVSIESGTAYVLPSSACDPMRNTLDELSAELRAANLPTGQAVVLGLRANKNSLSLVAEKRHLGLLRLKTASTPFLSIEALTDPRPLYFIPYDPDCDQSAEEQAFCRRILYERMQAEVLGLAGRTVPPRTLTLTFEDLLNRATMGMYELWENRNTRTRMCRLTRELVTKLAGAVCEKREKTFVEIDSRTWELRIADNEVRDIVLDVLSRFSCEAMDLKAEPPPTLFDGVETQA